MLEHFVKTIEEEVQDLLRNDLPTHRLEKACDMIIEAEKNGGRVHITGIGKPSYVAGYVASLLSSTGTPAYVLDGTEAVHGSSGQVKKEDIVIAISNSGETKELLDTVHALLENGARVIGVSKEENSSLSRLSDVPLVTKVAHEGDDLGKPPRASVLNQMILLQCLSILLQEAKGIDLETYGKWHPAGAIGASIEKKEPTE